MRFQKSLYILLTYIICNSCSQNKSKVSADCIELNNKATEMLNSYYSANNQTDLDDAVKYYSEAVKCDSTYLQGYLNLANVYDVAHKYDEKVQVLNKLIKLTNGDPYMLFLKGMVYEKIDKIDSASKVYQLARKEYNRMLSIRPKDIRLINGKIILIAVMNGKDAAIKELSDQITLNPELKEELSKQYATLELFNHRSLVFGEVGVTDLSENNESKVDSNKTIP